MPDGPRLRGFLATPEPREKNAMEGALRGARLRLAREAYAVQAKRHVGGHTGGGSHTTRQPACRSDSAGRDNRLLGAASWQGLAATGQALDLRPLTGSAPIYRPARVL